MQQERTLSPTPHFAERYPMIAAVTDYGIGINDTRPELPLKHLSNSQRVSYAICPAQAKFRRIEKRPDITTTDMLRGTVLHTGFAATMIAIMQNTERDVALELGRAAIRTAMLHAYDAVAHPKKWSLGIAQTARWDKGPPATLATVADDALDALPLLVDAVLQRFTPITVEHGVSITWQPDQGPKDPSVGFPDFLGYDKTTNALCLLDVKTGTKTKSLSSLLSDDALWLYGPPLERILGEDIERIGYCCVVFGAEKGQRKIRVVFVSDNDDGSFGILYDPRRVRRVATHQLGIERRYNLGLFDPIETTWACDRCAYHEPCEETYGPTGITQKLTFLQPEHVDEERSEVPTATSAVPDTTIVANGDTDDLDPRAIAASMPPLVATVDARRGFTPIGGDLFDPFQNRHLLALAQGAPSIATWPRHHLQILAAIESRDRWVSRLFPELSELTMEELTRRLAATIHHDGAIHGEYDLRRHLATALLQEGAMGENAITPT